MSFSHRCICPEGTWGSRCKIVIRHFEGGVGGQEGGSEGRAPSVGGWAWVPPIPPCDGVHVSLEVLTRSSDATLLYSGPELGTPRASGEMLLLLELRQGRPSLLLDLGYGPTSLTLKDSYSLADNTWHRIDLLWKEKVRSSRQLGPLV